MTTLYCELDLFREILFLAEMSLTTGEVKKLLLFTDNVKNSVFHVAAEFCERVISGIFNLAKQNLITNEVTRLLLATDNWGGTVFHMAADFRVLHVFQVLFSLVKENITEEVKNCY